MKSEGKCFYCKEKMAGERIADHLNEHLRKFTYEKPSRSASVFHLQVKAEPYFLNLIIKDNATLKELDVFLRKIWLECCGHLSTFQDGSSLHKTKLMDCFVIGKYYKYEYDFGDTTYLDIHVVDRFPMYIREKIILLSRNEPFKITCSLCKKQAATVICPIHMMQEDNGIFCPDCAKRHEIQCDDFDDEYSLPVVNSPRMGVCGYEGGLIDKTRDVYKMKN